MKRVINTRQGNVPEMTPIAALKLLRTTHVDEDGLLPLHEAREVLFMAFPQAVRLDEYGDRRINWRLLLDCVCCEFIPAFNTGKAQGRPPAKKDGLVERVDQLVLAGQAQSITHACSMIDRRKEFPGITNAKAAYYRRRKNPLR